MKIKKMMCLSGFLIFQLLITSCAVDFPSPPPPYGVWESEEPKIVLDINPDTAYLYGGEYTHDGITSDLIIQFHNDGRGFDILDSQALQGDTVIGLDYTYFVGKFTIWNNTMTYTLFDNYAEKTGYEKIKFRLVEEYNDKE